MGKEVEWPRGQAGRKGRETGRQGKGSLGEMRLPGHSGEGLVGLQMGPTCIAEQLLVGFQQAKIRDSCSG